MKNTMPLLLCDFYKVTHQAQFNPETTLLTSYFTPRMSRLENEDKLVLFGLQSFIKKYLVDYFNENFFKCKKEDVLGEYERILKYSIGEGTYDTSKIAALYDLGYLPVKIRAIKEGTRVPIKVPMIEISNTVPDFFWVGQALESLMSCSLWHPMCSANVGYRYRQIVNKYYDISVDNDVPRSRALGDFSMRGQESLESAVASSAGFCLSFLNTATVATIPYLEYYYNCDCTKEPVASGSVSTEHSVMTSNYAIDGDEKTFIKKLLTELYPDTSFSMVSDSYDYWNIVDNILPELKEEIMNHNGTLLVRGDSGDPVEIVTETVFRLWKSFGGTVNSKGFKVLDPHIKAIYGDSITIQRCEQIYRVLIKNGFACNNVTLGVGSFSMQCIEEGGGLKPFTRDTYGIAVKATYGEVNNEPVMIFKNPVTDSGHFKKSQKGMCRVYRDGNGEITYSDEYTSKNIPSDNLLETVFENGKMIKEYTLTEIRNLLHNNNF